ncbi:hypothetical protein HGA64_01055 [Candidatus Falkowbacteria bacterium]|nr:hypothetical protein [Candidatus Falkowbacteria bacterium]
MKMNKTTLLFASLGVGALVLTAFSAVYAEGTVVANQRTRAVNATAIANADQFSKMHQLMAEGKYEEAQKIRESLGMGQGRLAGGCASGQRGGCRMRNGAGGRGLGYIDNNNNGVCDHAELTAR